MPIFDFEFEQSISEEGEYTRKILAEVKQEQERQRQQEMHEALQRMAIMDPARFRQMYDEKKVFQFSQEASGSSAAPASGSSAAPAWSPS